MMSGAKVKGDLTEVELTLICEKFHVLPSQVMEEDAYLMRRVYAISGELERIRSMKRNRKGKK